VNLMVKVPPKGPKKRGGAGRLHLLLQRLCRTSPFFNPDVGKKGQGEGVDGHPRTLTNERKDRTQDIDLIDRKEDQDHPFKAAWGGGATGSLKSAGGRGG